MMDNGRGGTIVWGTGEGELEIAESAVGKLGICDGYIRRRPLIIFSGVREYLSDFYLEK